MNVRKRRISNKIKGWKPLLFLAIWMSLLTFTRMGSVGWWGLMPKTGA